MRIRARRHGGWTWLPGTAWGAAAAVLVGFTILAGPGQLAAQRPPAAAAEGSSLWISESPLGEASRLLIVVDPVGRHAALYHVDAAAGTLTLRSTRDIAWDLLVDDFNGQEPRPAALKKMLQVGPATAPDRPR
jgi:hypothetical protein